MLFEDGTGFCPWHKRDSSFKQVHSVYNAAPIYSAPLSQAVPRAAYEQPTRTGVLILQCLHCSKSVVLLEHELKPVKDLFPEGRKWRTMVSPGQSPRTLAEAAPEGVRSLFAEASKCENAGAMRGAGVLYRAAVEELVEDQKATGPKLWHKIESLKGKLPDELVEDLHEARLLGNDSIHDGITYSAEEVADVAGLIEEAVLVLYVQPEQKRAMREARKARRSASA